MKLVCCSLCPVTKLCRFSQEKASIRLGLHEAEMSAKEKQDAIRLEACATKNCPLRKVVEAT